MIFSSKPTKSHRFWSFFQNFVKNIIDFANLICSFEIRSMQDVQQEQQNPALNGNYQFRVFFFWKFQNLNFFWFFGLKMFSTFCSKSSKSHQCWLINFSNFMIDFGNFNFNFFFQKVSADAGYFPRGVAEIQKMIDSWRKMKFEENLNRWNFDDLLFKTTKIASISIWFSKFR